ncbi:MAG: hypothetical protein N3D16_02310 [Anaerolineales bacterium]|nr:hypothetical protein [Anaerolineales bacterium]
MTRKTIITVTVLIAVLAVVGIGAFTFFTVRAQSDNTNFPAWDGNRPFGGRMGKGPGFGADGEALAQALGISLEELQSAQQKAQETALKQAVEQGLITQKQADWLQSKGRPSPLDRRLFAWLSRNGIDMNALLADALGITPEQLNEARAKAVDIAIDQAVADGKITQEQADLMKARRALFTNENFINAMRSAFEAAVKKAVQEGVITQDQADLILQQLQLRPRSQGIPDFPPIFGGHPSDFPPFGQGEGEPLPPAPAP